MSGAGAAWANETTWGGGGGGITAGGIPLYQQGLSATNGQVSSTNRNLPDVSMDAVDFFVVYSNCNAGSSGNGNCTPTQAQGNQGGTSLSAPLWNGFMALVNEQRHANGLSPVGFANPALYRIGNDPTQRAAAFHDIQDGSSNTNSCNFGYNAVAGYDLATGWGSPRCEMIRELGAATPCVPTTCAAALANCGTVADGCGENLSCGSCGVNQVCIQVAAAGQAFESVCCTRHGCGIAQTCGVASDGCGGVVVCGPPCGAPPKRCKLPLVYCDATKSCQPSCDL